VSLGLRTVNTMNSSFQASPHCGRQNSIQRQLSIQNQRQLSGQNDEVESGMSTDLRVELLGHRHDMLEMLLRNRAANMLGVGSMFGLVGFGFAFITGVIKSNVIIDALGEGNYCTNYKGEPMEVCYFPSTLSEMVCDTSDPGGKIFFFFEFVGGLFIFLSFYPTMLRNVYIGDDAKVDMLPACAKISWVSVRQYFPATGLMMLSVITTVPVPQANVLDYFCIGLHLLGASMMFVGYFLVEAVTIGYGPWVGLAQHKRRFDENEDFQRRICLHGIVFFYVIFCFLQGIFTVEPGDGYDEWETPKGLGAVPGLLKAAEPHIKWLKILSYATEVICGVLLVLNQLIIWYHCEERHYDLYEELMHIKEKPAEITTELQACSTWAARVEPVIFHPPPLMLAKLSLVAEGIAEGSEDSSSIVESEFPGKGVNGIPPW